MIRRWLQELTLKKLITIALGWCITLAGAVTFVALMGIGIAPLVANLMCKLFTTQVRFTLRRRTRPGARTKPPWPQWCRYQCQKAITTVANYGLFLLAMAAEIPNLLAYFACLMLVKPLGLAISRWYTFPSPGKESD